MITQNIAFSIIKKFKIQAFCFGVLGGLIGLFIYLGLPVTYTAKSLLYVTRELNNTQLAETEFNYEGYYAQQNAALYSTSVAAILESEQLHATLLGKQNIPISREELNKFDRNLTVSKKSPQVIEVSIKATNPDDATFVLKNMIFEAQSEVNKVNTKTSETFIIEEVGSIFVTQNYRNVYLNVISGFVIAKVLYLGLKLITETENLLTKAK